jgi:hypothetical protein
MLLMGCETIPPSTIIDRVIRINDQSDNPCIVIYVMNYFAEDPNIVFALWPNGRVIWSRDQLSGGSPYYESILDQKQIRHFFSVLDQEGVFKSSRNKYDYLPLSDLGKYHFITLCWKGKEAYYVSDHEFYPEHSNTRSVSWIYIDGPYKGKIGSSDSAEYLEFRRDWSSIREKVGQLIPQERGTAVNVQFRCVDMKQDSNIEKHNVLDNHEGMLLPPLKMKYDKSQNP